MGRHDDALLYIQKALEKLPEDPLITEHLGDTYMALGKWREAREAYEKALRLGHENPDQLENKIEKTRRKANNKQAR
jgi:tetratricopeptide (TPR) repeat protein